MANEQPRFVGPYRILRKLGQGGMGEVYLADDARLDRQVALKTITTVSPAAPVDHARLRAEARAAARLNHPNIASIYDVLETDDGPCIVMEYVEGETLATRIARSGSLAIDETIRFGIQLARALGAAHAQGVVHRDVKPGNIQITPEGQLKLLDLGIAKMGEPLTSDPITTRPATVLDRAGTPAYMSPEQIRLGRVGPTSDVYSTGVVLFEMLAGHRPFPATDRADLGMQMVTAPAPDVRQFAPDVPPALSAIIAKALSLNPVNRFEDGNALAEALTSFTVPGGAALLVAEPVTTRRRTSRVAAYGFVTLVGVAIAAFALLMGRRAEQPTVESLTAPRVGIAVLPVLNLSADERTAQLASGLSSLLVRNLAAIPNSTITAGAVNQRFRAEAAEASKLADERQVSHLLDLSLQRLGEQYRMDVRLLQKSGEEIWRNRYDGDMLFIQREMLRDLAGVFSRTGVLRRGLTATGREQFHRLPTENLTAFTHYSEGRAILDSPERTARAHEAAEAFERAIAADARFALALAALSEASRVTYQRTREEQWLKKATVAAENAVAVDGTLAAAHYALGSVRNATARPEEAIRSLRTAITLEPSFDEAHRLLGSILASRGQVEEGIKELQHALEFAPDSWNNQYTLAFIYYNAGRNREAIPHLRRVTELLPNYSSAYLLLGASHQRLGEISQAIGYYEHATRIGANANAWTNLGKIYYDAGRFQDALAAFLKAVALDKTSAGLRRNAGDAYARLGQRRQATQMYEEAAALATNAIALNARDASSIAMLALCEAKLGRHDLAVRHAAEAVVLSPEDRDVLYKQAAVHALANQPGPALEALRRAIDRGYERQLARDDDDLKNLRALPEFRRLTEAPAAS